MPVISEKEQNKKISKYDINIKTKFVVENEILERNTNDTHNDDIEKGIIIKKEYYQNNKLVHTETDFDSRIEYTYLSKKEEEKEHTCSNCGMKGKVKEFLDGCPYCRTIYNIDYSDKELGNKYHYDRILKNNKYRVITYIVDLIVCLILSFIYIKTTSRTFNNIDIIKIFVYGLVASLLLYYFFYILDAYIVLGPIKRYKDKQNKKQIEFWNRTGFDKKVFFNNLNYEIKKYYYRKENIIDYDILDYIEFKEYNKNNTIYVDIKTDIRIVYIENNKIISKLLSETFTMKKHEKGVFELKEGTNMIKCGNCGASIDATKGYCTYCKAETKYLQEWIIDEKK